MGKDRRNVVSEIEVYKMVDGIMFNVYIFYLENYDKKKVKFVYLFFYGGGWVIGFFEWSYDVCKGVINEGRVVIVFDFCLRNIYGIDVKIMVSDVLLVIVWVRENVKDLGIDFNKVFVDGFFLGVYLVLILSLIENFEDFGVILRFSLKLDVLIFGFCFYDIVGRDVYNIKYDIRIILLFYFINENFLFILVFYVEDDCMVKFFEFKKFRDVI